MTILASIIGFFFVAAIVFENVALLKFVAYTVITMVLWAVAFIVCFIAGMVLFPSSDGHIGWVAIAALVITAWVFLVKHERNEAF